MRKNVSKALSAIVIAAMAMSLAACGSSTDTNTNTETDSNANAATSDSAASSNASSTESTGLKIGIVVKTASNAHFQDISYGAVLAGQDNGVEVVVNNTATESDVDGQITMCEDMITQGVDALILTPNDSDGVGVAVEAAHDAGVPFITVDTEITNDWGDDVAEYMPTYIGVDHEEMSYTLAKQVFDAIGGEGDIVILRGVDAASSSQERTAGFEKAVEEYSGINVVESQSASYDQDTATTTMADIIQAHPDIKAVLCCNDLMAKGACTALEENGIEVGGETGVKVAGIDGNVLALESIADGEIYATAYDWSILQGYYAVEQALTIINGGTPEELIYTPYTIISADNIDDYLEHGEELSQWTMGTEIQSVSDYMRNFVEMGEGL